MANDLNKHSCIGRLGKDVEVKYMPNGSAVANISVACGETWKDKQTGQRQERTTWIPYVAFGKLAEIMSQYLKKGSRVYLEGQLRVRKWQDQSGQDRYTTEIIAKEMQMLDSRSDSAQGQQAAPQQAQAHQTQQQNAYGSPSMQAQQPAQQAPPQPDQHQPAQGFDNFDDDITF